MTRSGRITRSHQCMAIDWRETISLMEQPSARPRRGPTSHYTLTSNALIFGYHDLDDGAKLTYQAIDSFDWPDQAGERKGYAYPSVPTLARLRGTSERTIQRHCDALEDVGLLRREYLAGKPARLWIEEPSAQEAEKYSSTIDKRGDTDVTPTPDTDVTPYKKEEISKKDESSLNESQRLWEQKGRGERLTALEKAKRDWLANHMVDQLGDPHSLNFYRKVAGEVPEHRVFQALSEVRLATREALVRKPPAMFVSLIAKGGEAG